MFIKLFTHACCLYIIACSRSPSFLRLWPLFEIKMLSGIKRHSHCQFPSKKTKKKTLSQTSLAINPNIMSKRSKSMKPLLPANFKKSSTNPSAKSMNPSAKSTNPSAKSMNPSAKSTNPSAKSTNMSAKSRNRKNYEILPNQPSQKHFSEELALWYENEGRESQSDSQSENQSESESDDELSNGIIDQR